MWKPADGWKVTLLGDVQRFSGGAPRVAPLSSGGFKVTSDVGGKNRRKVETAALRVAFEGRAFRLLSVSAFRNWRQDPLETDLDFTSAPLLRLKLRRRERRWSQELRFQSPAGFHPWEWRAGLFASLVRDRQKTAMTFPGAVEGSRQKLRQQNYALFVQVGYHGVDRLGLRMGLRLEHVRQRFRRERQGGLFGPLPENLKNRSWRYFFVASKLSLDYLLIPGFLAYGSTALAFRPGGFAATDLAGFDRFDRERLWASEIGIQGIVLERRLPLDLRLFYYRIRDYQVERFFTPTELFVVNVPEAVSRGLEVEMVAKPTRWLDLEARFGYTRTHFERFTDPVSGRDLSGNAAPFVPRYNFLLAATVRPLKAARVRLEAVGRGETHFDDLNRGALRERPYTLLNLRAEYAIRGFTLYGEVTNLTNVHYFTQRIPALGFLPVPPQGVPGLPRQFPVGVRISF